MPESGALIFCEEFKCLAYGDGFNWIRLQPRDGMSALALALNTPQVEPCVEGVPELAVFYDTVVYNIGSAFTPAGGNQILMNKDMTFDFSADIVVSADVANVDYILHTYLNSVLVATRRTNLHEKNVPLGIVILGAVPVSENDILTIQVEMSKTCNLTTHQANSGLHEQC